MQRDPAPNLNRYGYANGNPISNYDPSGRSSQPYRGLGQFFKGFDQGFVSTFTSAFGIVPLVATLKNDGTRAFSHWQFDFALVQAVGLVVGTVATFGWGAAMTIGSSRFGLLARLSNFSAQVSGTVLGANAAAKAAHSRSFATFLGGNVGGFFAMELTETQLIRPVAEAAGARVGYAWATSKYWKINEKTVTGMEKDLAELPARFAGDFQRYLASGMMRRAVTTQEEADQLTYDASMEAASHTKKVASSISRRATTMLDMELFASDATSMQRTRLIRRLEALQNRTDRMMNTNPRFVGAANVSWVEAFANQLGDAWELAGRLKKAVALTEEDVMPGIPEE